MGARIQQERRHRPHRHYGEIEVQHLSKSVLLFMPLCPSTNARTIPISMGGHPRTILTKEAREYIEENTFLLKSVMATNGLKPIDHFSYVDLWFILPRTNCDAHNYGKVLFDVLQAGGVFTNDKFILPRIQGVTYDPQNPLAIVQIQKNI